MTQPLIGSEQKMEHGLCPFMSGRPIVLPAGGGLAVNQMQVSISTMPCVGDKCQLWDLNQPHNRSAGGFCGLKRAAIELAGVSDSLFEISNGVKALEPPKYGPLSRMADALDKLVDVLVQFLKRLKP